MKPRIGDDWIALATLNGNPQCGLYAVRRRDGSTGVVGTCWEKHSHGESLAEAFRVLEHGTDNTNREVDEGVQGGR